MDAEKDLLHSKTSSESSESENESTKHLSETKQSLPNQDILLLDSNEDQTNTIQVTSNINVGKQVCAIKRKPIIYKIPVFLKKPRFYPIEIEKKAQNSVRAMRRTFNNKMYQQKSNKKDNYNNIPRTIFNTPQQRILTRSGLQPVVTIKHNFSHNSTTILRKYDTTTRIIGPTRWYNELNRYHYEGIIFLHENSTPCIAWKNTMQDAFGIGITLPCRVGGLLFSLKEIIEILNEMKNAYTLRLEITEDSRSDLISLVQIIVNYKAWETLFIITNYTWKQISNIFPLHKELHISYIKYEEKKINIINRTEGLPTRETLY